MIDIHTHIKNKNLFAVYNVHLNKFTQEDLPNNWFSVGLHPWAVSAKYAEILDLLPPLAKKNNCLAIGEIGLDRVRKENWEYQVLAFESQLKIAQKLKKPVVIHAVRSYSDILFFRKKSDINIPWIVHDFYGNKQEADKLMEKNCFLSFGHRLLKSTKLRGVFKGIPIDRIFFETDESELDIKQIYEFAAALKNIDIESLKEQVWVNLNLLKPK